MTHISSQQLQALKKQLKQLLLSEAALQHLIQEANQSIELDQSRMGRLSRMDAMQTQQISQEVVRRQQNYNLLVKKALAKIESGEYGYCSNCDEEINIKRLQADPTHYLCIRCAE